MGVSYHVVCKDCGHKFKVSEGGGSFFHILHCDECGKEISVKMDDNGVAHYSYIDGEDVTSSTVIWDEADSPDDGASEPVSEQEYESEVEKTAGKCKCGGSFRFIAPPRCPKCRSTSCESDSGGEIVCFD